MKNLLEAMNKAMSEISPLIKNMLVGAGNSSYEALSDFDVKMQIMPILIKNGIVIFQTKILEKKTTISDWEEKTDWGVKRKQQVFKDFIFEYEMYHVSGERITLQSSATGIDSQDKADGKAATYALKYLIINNFFIPVGKKTDLDADHSDDKEVPQKKYPQTSNNKTKVDGWLSEKQLDVIIGKADKTEIENYLKFFNGKPQAGKDGVVKTRAMKREFKEKLETLLKTL